MTSKTTLPLYLTATAASLFGNSAIAIVLPWLVLERTGDPAMAGEEIDISLVEKGISVVVNPEGDRRRRRPNVIQTAFAELFNEFNEVRSDLSRQGKKVEALGKQARKKLNL